MVRMAWSGHIGFLRRCSGTTDWMLSDRIYQITLTHTNTNVYATKWQFFSEFDCMEVQQTSKFTRYLLGYLCKFSHNWHFAFTVRQAVTVQYHDRWQRENQSNGLGCEQLFRDS